MAHVGFVGVGRMGANMARRLQDKGYRITAVHDRNQQATDELSRELGCEAVETPARVAELSEVVVTVVIRTRDAKSQHAGQGHCHHGGLG